MSYILEALKKAQAERQLGHTPDIHAPAPVHLPTPAAGAKRTPLLIGLALGALVAALVGVLAWRSGTPAPAAASPSASPAVLAEATVPVVAVAEIAPAPPAAASAVPPEQAPPVARKRESAAAPVAAAPVRPAAPPSRLAQDAPQAVYLPAPAAVADTPPIARAPDPVPDEPLRTLQQLPEAIQREVPKITVGGYIYSANPADRLLLVDKLLRREGDELATGLVLERLTPKYAVMNYRGTRYRVAY